MDDSESHSLRKTQRIQRTVTPCCTVTRKLQPVEPFQIQSEAYTKSLHCMLFRAICACHSSANFLWGMLNSCLSCFLGCNVFFFFFFPSRGRSEVQQNSSSLSQPHLTANTCIVVLKCLLQPNVRVKNLMHHLFQRTRNDSATVDTPESEIGFTFLLMQQLDPSNKV